MQSLRFWMVATLVLSLSQTALPMVVTFDDLSLGSESYWNGSDLSGELHVLPDPWFPGSTMDVYYGGFQSAGVYFPNTYNATYWSWDGWAYSNCTDNQAGGIDPNTYQIIGEYSAMSGGGYESANYGVAFVGFTAPPTASFSADVFVAGAYFTNTAYAYFDMLSGSQFSKKFGGASGDDPDWFKLTITGLDAAGAPTGSVDFYLADYRFADNNLDYIVSDWQWVDLSSLGAVRSLAFTLSSSDTGSWGMNTPAYFAMDHLSYSPVPEPATLALLLSAILWGFFIAGGFMRVEIIGRKV